MLFRVFIAALLIAIVEIESKVETLVTLACKAAYWQAVSENRLSPHEDEDEILCAMRYTPVMVGGAPWLMAPLVAGLKAAKLTPVFAYSQRESVDTVNEDGTVSKTSIFVHRGWITA